MRIAAKALLFGFLLMLAGCVRPPLFGQAGPTIGPVPAGEARLYLYRNLEIYDSIAPTEVYLNGQTVGVAYPGAVLYRDVAPGTYQIAVHSDGWYYDQFKTVTVKAGDTLYARVDSLHAWYCQGVINTGCPYETFVVNLIAPQVAVAELPSLYFINN
jgi:hypothetical protein